MYTTVVIGGILLIVALVGVAMWCCYRAGWDNGYEQAGADGKQEVADERAEKRHEARHARTQPRRRPDKTSLVLSDALPVNDWYEPPPGPIQSHTSAVDIYPVILPEPGRYQPQPVRDSGPGTITFAKLDKPATTGEMAAVTDDYIAQMAVDEETFRLGLAT